MKPSIVILHCSDTPDNPKNELYDTRPEHIEEWHKARGFNKIGYHFIITRDGVIHRGRGEAEKGAHTKGHNTGSLGVCLVGRNVFTSDQMDSLFSLYLRLKDSWGIESKNWFGHYEFSDKTCPNLDMEALRDRLAKL